MVSKEEVYRRYKILNKIYNLYKNYKKYSKISITDFESYYGEILVAEKLVESGFQIEKEHKEGCDFVIRNNKKIEVKTSRAHERFSGSKEVGWGWVVTQSQWKEEKFDFLVCIALDYEKRDPILVFTSEEVRKFFSKGSWEYLKYKKHVKDYKRLDLFRKGLDSLEDYTRIAREKIKLKGKPTKFEIDFNKHPNKIFQKYNWQRFVRLLKTQNL